MKKITKKIIHTVTNYQPDVTNHYELHRKVQDVVGNITRKRNFIDSTILVEDTPISIRIFSPKEKTDKAILYYHGGGWVVGNIQNYTKTCADLANKTKRIVISVDYRLAPEYPFPIGFQDCYGVTKYFYTKKNMLGLKPKNITIMGDSAGATIAAGISLLARDQKDFKIKNQILIYPLTYFEHNENSPYVSIKENGRDWILTTKRINEYMDLYIQDKQYLKSPYVAPLNATNLKHQPRTLMITAEYDPLRDEGEAYGNKLKEAHNEVTIYRVQEAIHGFFNLPIPSKALDICYQEIIKFLQGENL